MRITRQHLRRTIRKVLKEGTMKRYYGEIQNAVLDCCDYYGGECTVDDCIPYVVQAAPFLDRPGSQYDSMYDEVVELLHQFCEDGVLEYIGDDMFQIGPEYR